MTNILLAAAFAVVAWLSVGPAGAADPRADEAPGTVRDATPPTNPLPTDRRLPEPPPTILPPGSPPTTAVPGLPPSGAGRMGTEQGAPGTVDR